MLRRPLPLYLMLSLLLWPVYRYGLLPELEIYLHSDSAVPYITAIEPWLPQDFFFWSAERFGSLYAVPWKLVGKPLFGLMSSNFYAMHLGYFFVGNALWLAAVASPGLALCFFLLTLPLVHDRIDEFLYPGHLYGALYFYTGVIVYLLVSRQRLSWRSGLALAVSAAAAYWQHALVGVIMIALILLKYACIVWESPAAGEQRPPFWRTLLPFVATLSALLWVIEVARRWAFEWAGPYYFHLEDWAQFSDNLRDFALRGLSFQINPLFGLTLVASVVIGLVTALKLVRQGRGPVFLRLFVPSLFGLGIAIVIGFNAHPRYTVSGRSERYFAFLVPLLLLAFSLLPRIAVGRKARWFGPVVLVLLTGISSYRQLYQRHKTPLDPDFMTARYAEYHEHQRRIRILLAARCHGVVDGYWQAYVLTALTSGALPASPSDDPRNPVYLTKILHADNYCVGRQARLTSYIQNTVRLSRCTCIDGEYKKCRILAGPPQPY